MDKNNKRLGVYFIRAWHIDPIISHGIESYNMDCPNRFERLDGKIVEKWGG